MEEYLIQSDTLTGIANAIREKTGKTENINVLDMASEIASISVGSNIISGSVKLEGSNIESVTITCEFMPSKLVMYGGEIGTIGNVWELVYDVNGLDEDGSTMHASYYTLTTDTIDMKMDGFTINLDSNNNNLVITAPDDLYFAVGTWTYIAIE